MRAIIATIVAIALGWGTAAAAADAPSASAGCELHVWPAARMTQDPFFGGRGDRGPTIISPMPGLDIEALMTPAEQNRVFADIDLATMLGVAGARTVLHDTPLPVGEQRSNDRRAAAETDCYAELIVLRIFYARLGMGDRQLQSFFLFRRFNEGRAPVREFSQSGETRLHLFPPHVPEPVAPALAELVDGFKADVTIFAGKVSAPPAPPRNRGRVDW